VKPFPPLKTDSDDMLHLDALRAIGAVLIVVFHFNRFINIDGRWQAVDDTVKSFSLLVDLFFVISGYVISAVYTGRIRTVSDFRWFLQKRVARLMPLHWLTLGVFIVIAVAGVLGLVNDRDPSRYDPACVVPNLLNLQAFGICRAQTFNFVSWSISAEWAMYLILPVLLWLAGRGTAWLTLATAAILAGLFAVPLFVPSAAQPFHMWTADFGIARAAPGFMIGMIAYGIRGPLGRLPGARWWFFGSCVAFVAGAAVQLDRGILLFACYAVGLLGVAADNAPVKAGAVVRWLAPWGQLSYSIYMLHPIVLKIALNWVGLGMLHLSGDVMRLWCLVWGLVLIPVSYASLMYFEKPARDAIAGWGKKRKPLP